MDAAVFALLTRLTSLTDLAVSYIDVPDLDQVTPMPNVVSLSLNLLRIFGPESFFLNLDRIFPNLHHLTAEYWQELAHPFDHDQSCQREFLKILKRIDEHNAAGLFPNLRICTIDSYEYQRK